MHDPQTVAHEIRYPWRAHKPWPKSAKKWEDLSPRQKRGRSSMWREGYRNTFITIWHVDPETDHTDDSCGWFMRARHGNKEVLDRIVKRFEMDWDRVFKSDSGNSYLCGYFCPNGDPHFSVHGIVLNLFFIAAGEYFNTDGRRNWKESRRWMQENLFDILMFAENPVDSLFDNITRKFEIACGEPHTHARREERIKSMASCIYAWILRRERPWYKHPKWHVHHWKIQCHPLQSLKRWLFSRCSKCGKRFSWGYSPVTNQWDGTGPRWFKGEKGVFHSGCDQIHAP